MSRSVSLTTRSRAPRSPSWRRRATGSAYSFGVRTTMGRPSTRTCRGLGPFAPFRAFAT
ncbi:hypothetical protein [Streptomyces sp. NPDC090025]|uniref:hypothetical protein n=1 Tax=Streptomyces sp. NPDC090025 TaxID=3365922 RepID=UPI003834B18B